MITQNIETYKCEFCRKLYTLKRFAIKHEPTCKKNPLNIRACFNCQNCERREVNVFLNFGDQFGRQAEEVRSLFYCKAKDEYLLPPNAEHRGNCYETDLSNNPMPLECELHKLRED